jgi:hypothetical protein
VRHATLAVVVAIVAVAMLVAAILLRLRMHRHRRGGVSFWQAEMQALPRRSRFYGEGQALGATVALLGWSGIVLLLAAMIVFMWPW